MKKPLAPLSWATCLWLLLAGALPAVAGCPSFTDDSGRPVEVCHPYQRIISLYAAHTEVLYALGAEDRLVGVGQSDDWPPQVKDKPQFSYRGGVERILAARPDLVLVRPMIWQVYQPLLDQLTRAGVAVISLQPRGPAEMYETWRRLGLLVGKPQAADQLVADFQKQLEALKARTADLPPDQRQGVYFESIHRRMKTFAPQSTAIMVLEAAGGANLASDAQSVRDTNIADYGKEHILALAPRLDAYIAQVGPMNPVTREEILGEPGFAALPAVRNGRVLLVPEALVSRPTPRLLEGVARIGHFLYPERFEAPQP